MKSHSVGIQLGGILGMIGLFVMGANTWVGIGMILAAAAIVFLSIWKPKIPNGARSRVRTQVPRKATHSMQQATSVNPKSLSLLKRTLYQANLDPRAPVLAVNNETILTVQDILVKLIQASEAQGIRIPELAKDITKIYKRIFQDAGQAIAQHPDDTDRLALWLANQALRDVRKELEAN